MPKATLLFLTQTATKNKMSKNLGAIVILANGEFPFHKTPLAKLKNAKKIICCDGAAEKLIKAGIKPTAIVGDMDSLSYTIQQEYRDIIFKHDCQESNDLTKAFNYALKLKPTSITILGATGMREDHSLGNISLLAKYSVQTKIPIEMPTNYGVFKVIFNSGQFPCEPGKQISLFPLNKEVKIESKGLKYPLDSIVFDSWWKATLNESEGYSYQLKLSEPSPIIIFTAY